MEVYQLDGCVGTALSGIYQILVHAPETLFY
jgi:hypothetical protein